MSCVRQLKRAHPRAGFVIRAMGVHDLIEVVEIEEASGLSLWGWDSYHTELSRTESITLVARERDALLGDQRLIEGFVVARLSGDEVHVNNLGVRERSRRRGVGRALLREALRRGMCLGARAALLEVRAGNHAAQSLYRRFGFEICGRRRNYYRQPAEDALIMRAELSVRA